MPDHLTPEQRDAILDALLAGRKIEAIKLYREATGLGLKEAKEYLDALVAELAKEHPELLKKSGGGCGAAALVLILLGGTLVTSCLFI